MLSEGLPVVRIESVTVPDFYFSGESKSGGVIMTKLNYERLRFIKRKSDYDGSHLPRAGSFADRRRYMWRKSGPLSTSRVLQNKTGRPMLQKTSPSTPEVAAAERVLQEKCRSLLINIGGLSEGQREALSSEMRKLIGFILARKGGKDIYTLVRSAESILGRPLCAHSISSQRIVSSGANGFQVRR